MSLYEAETSWAEVPKGLSDLGPKWKKAEVTGYPAEYYGFAIFHIMIYIYFIAALSHRQRVNSYYRSQMNTHDVRFVLLKVQSETE